MGDAGQKRSAWHRATWVWHQTHQKKIAHRSVCGAVRHWVELALGTNSDGRAGLRVYECRFSDDRYEAVNGIIRHGRGWLGSAGRHWHVGHEEKS